MVALAIRYDGSDVILKTLKSIWFIIRHWIFNDMISNYL